MHEEGKKQYTIVTIPRSGVVVRVEEEEPERLCELKIEDMGTAIPLIKKLRMKACAPLPECAVGKDIIVSWVYAEQFLSENPDYPHRVLVPHTGPGSVVRSEEGAIIGCKMLIHMNARYEQVRQKRLIEPRSDLSTLERITVIQEDLALLAQLEKKRRSLEGEE